MAEFPSPPRLHVLHVPGADPARDAAVAALVAQGDVCVHADPDRRGCMWNYTTAVECAESDGTGISWQGIVSDDAIPLPGWQQHYERACLNSPSPILSLTYFGQYVADVAAKGYAYATGTNLLWGGAIAYHRSVLPRLLPIAQALTEVDHPHDTDAPALLAYTEGWNTACVTRAVFDQSEEIRSLLGHNLPNRSPRLTIRDSGPGYRSGHLDIGGRVDRLLELLALIEESR